MAASSKQQQHAVGLPREKYCRISLPQNQPIMSSTPPVLVVYSHNQFMTQNSHNSRTSNSCGNPVTVYLAEGLVAKVVVVLVWEGHWKECKDWHHCLMEGDAAKDQEK
jgi:hypothetical protein